MTNRLPTDAGFKRRSDDELLEAMVSVALALHGGQRALAENDAPDGHDLLTVRIAIQHAEISLDLLCWVFGMGKTEFGRYAEELDCRRKQDWGPEERAAEVEMRAEAREALLRTLREAN